MILDLQRFATTERPFWTELERYLDRVEREPDRALPLADLRRFHYLYERTSAGLAKLSGFATEPEMRRYLESLVARAYGEVHETRARQRRFRPTHWFFQTLPQTFRRHINAFWLSVGITIAGAIFGGLAVAYDPDAKSAVLPEMFAGHLGDPNERVAREESNADHASAGQMSSFSAQLMVNNIGVSIKAMALGMTYGLGTIVILFYNGVILGLVAVDYVLAGQLKFLLGWLLPHGVIEVPAILIGGQAGLMLAHALIGRGQRNTIRTRLRAASADVVTLVFGVALLLVWAGLIEAFFSQYHEPVLPYAVKIAFGCVELLLFVLFLAKCGRGSERENLGAELDEPARPRAGARAGARTRTSAKLA
jgi:uncharacterized membrane protein SpoIIM required for sporulation